MPAVNVSLPRALHETLRLKAESEGVTLPSLIRGVLVDGQHADLPEGIEERLKDLEGGLARADGAGESGDYEARLSKIASFGGELAERVGVLESAKDNFLKWGGTITTAAQELDERLKSLELDREAVVDRGIHPMEPAPEGSTDLIRGFPPPDEE